MCALLITQRIFSGRSSCRCPGSDRLFALLGMVFAAQLYLGLHTHPGEWPWEFIFIIVICWMFNLYARPRSLGLDLLLWRETTAAKGGGGIAPFYAGLLSVRLKGEGVALAPGSLSAFRGIFRLQKRSEARYQTRTPPNATGREPRCRHQHRSAHGDEKVDVAMPKATSNSPSQFDAAKIGDPGVAADGRDCPVAVAERRLFSFPFTDARTASAA